MCSLWKTRNSNPQRLQMHLSLEIHLRRAGRVDAAVESIPPAGPRARAPSGQADVLAHPSGLAGTGSAGHGRLPQAPVPGDSRGDVDIGGSVDVLAGAGQTPPSRA